MIICSVPIRISLCGGSTDNPLYLEKYGTGSVISFPCNLRVYVTVHQDKLGTNAKDHKFIVNYSKREEVSCVNEIENDIVRETLKFLNHQKPLTISLTCDVPSVGSGLACSSAYIMALLGALGAGGGSESIICEMAYEIEKKINPLVGQQDFWGSISGGLKRIDFFKDKNPKITFLHPKNLPLDIYLVYTGISRSSTNILKTLDIDKCVSLINDVNDLEEALRTGKGFHEIINRTWENKKTTSSLICENKIIKQMDEEFTDDITISSRKLLGGGNGGYFLIFYNVDVSCYYHPPYRKYPHIPIHVYSQGIIIKHI